MEIASEINDNPLSSNTPQSLCQSSTNGTSGWESSENYKCEEPPLASEDSDIGDIGEFETFSSTEDEEENIIKENSELLDQLR